MIFSRAVPDVSDCSVVQCCHGVGVGRSTTRIGVEHGFQISFQHQAAVPSAASFYASLFQDSIVSLTHQVKAQDGCCLYSPVMPSLSVALVKNREYRKLNTPLWHFSTVFDRVSCYIKWLSGALTHLEGYL